MSDKLIIFICIGIFFVFGAATLAFKWYSSGIQADVWRREGAHMTQWEVFVGAKPIVRNIQVDVKP